MLRSEYAETIKAIDAYIPLPKLLIAASFLIAGLTYQLRNKRIRAAIEAYHIGYFVTNVVYIAAIYLNWKSTPVIFYLGGLAINLSILLLDRRVKPVCFIFSASFCHLFYMLLICQTPLQYAVFAAPAISLVAVGLSFVYRDAVHYVISKLCISTVLLSVGAYGVVTWLMEPSKGSSGFISDVSPVYPLVMFIFLVVCNASTRTKKHISMENTAIPPI